MGCLLKLSNRRINWKRGLPRRIEGGYVDISVRQVWLQIHALPLIFHMSFVVVQSPSRVPLCNLIDYSPSGSSVHGISQPRTLEWVAISYHVNYSNLKFLNLSFLICQMGITIPVSYDHIKDWMRWCMFCVCHDGSSVNVNVLCSKNIYR